MLCRHDMFTSPTGAVDPEGSSRTRHVPRKKPFVSRDLGVTLSAHAQARAYDPSRARSASGYVTSPPCFGAARPQWLDNMGRHTREGPLQALCRASTFAERWPPAGRRRAPGHRASAGQQAGHTGQLLKLLCLVHGNSIRVRGVKWKIPISNLQQAFPVPPRRW